MGNSYKYPFINKKEFQSLLFYQGASDHIELDPSESVLEDFYSIDNVTRQSIGFFFLELKMRKPDYRLRKEIK